MGFWTGADIEDRFQLGLLTQAQAEQEQQFRAAQRDALVQFLQNRGLLSNGNGDPDAVLQGWLKFLAENEEAFLLINLEDLWLEPAPQNTPGTWQERPNWQRKARLSLEAIRQSDSILQLLQTISDIRRRVG
jgi:4-alpha-glucanotransferase